MSETLEFAFASYCMVGHMMPLVPYMEELIGRGHNVTIFTSNEPKYAQALRNFGLHSVNVVGVDMESGKGKKKWWQLPMMRNNNSLCDSMLTYYEKRPNPACVIVDFFAMPAADAAELLKVPVVVVYPNPLGVFLSLPAPHLRNTIDTLIEYAVVWLVEPLLANVLLFSRNSDRSCRNLPPMLEQDMYPTLYTERPMICCTAIGFEYPSKVSPLVKFTGPTAPREFPALQNDEKDQKDGECGLLSWVENVDRKYIVYVAFGTMHTFTEEGVYNMYVQLMQLSMLSPAVQHTNSNQTLESKPTSISVLWSLTSQQQQMLHAYAEKKQLPMLAASNLRLVGFAPQWALLSHTKVVSFITHCGANSVYEALLNDVPMVCCPGMADQPCNAARIVSAGAGLLGDMKSQNGVLEPMLEVLNTLVVCRRNAESVRKVFTEAGGATAGADFILSITNSVYSLHTKVRRRSVGLMFLTAGVLFVAGVCVCFVFLRT